MRWFVILTGTIAVFLTAAGCGAQNSATEQRGAGRAVLTVSAASSLTQPFTEIGGVFSAENPDVEVRFNFDSSSALARQMTQGAQVDVFASADNENMSELADAGLVDGDPEAFATNRLTIVVKAGNPGGVKGLADLAGVGTVALCGQEVPCGRYADQMLAAAGVTLPADRITRGQNVRAVFAAVAEGDADAGIVYVTDVTGDGVEMVAVPDDHNVAASYPIAVLEGSVDRDAARAFLDFVTGPEGQRILQTAGFGPPG